MIEQLKQEFYNHAKQEYPRECCGVVILSDGSYRYIPCRNVSDEPTLDFEIDSEQMAFAEDHGELIAIVHSHPNAQPVASEGDLTEIEKHGIQWIIIGWPNGNIKTYFPSGYEAPLIGRDYFGGVLDCFTLAKDYYKRNLGIHVDDIERCDRWWEKGYDLLTPENFKKLGFEVVEELKTNDVIVMQNGKICNHLAVYLGNGVMLHHCYKRLSCKEVYGGYWLKNTRYTLRHKTKC